MIVGVGDLSHQVVALYSIENSPDPELYSSDEWQQMGVPIHLRSQPYH